ncbi:unnamed protein product, partial [Linum tenue]
SWDFLEALTQSNAAASPPLLSSRAPDSSNVVIGFLDTGIWPESESFRQNLTSIPRGWKGTCVTARDFNKTACNGTKIIGAKYYISHSPRDRDGHGSHVASTAAGVAVDKASFYDGLAAGTARGGSESAKIAMYKVCENRNCPKTAILKAFDDAIADGVHVISVSLGDPHPDFLSDPVAIGAFHAVEHGITVVCAAGNSGPRPSTILNDAPWVVTVGASTVDRAFRSDILLGGGEVVKGEWIRLPDLSRSPIYPLIDGRSAAKAGNLSRAARRCEPGSLSKAKTKGKIVICDIKDRNGFNFKDQLDKVALRGSLGIILANNDSKRVVQYQWDFPLTRVGSSGAAQILNYIKTTRYPDVTAPGLAILAAWIGDRPLDEKPKGRPQSSFEIDSGTSMSGVAANIKAAHPAFTPSAIKSAIMTTAFSNDNLGSPITSNNGDEATPYDLGAGELNPRGSLNPGLVYETSVTDYLIFMCYHGYNTSTVRSMSKVARSTGFSCPDDSGPDLISNINYPSISVLLRGANQIRTVPRVLTNVAGSGNWTYRA